MIKKIYATIFSILLGLMAIPIAALPCKALGGAGYALGTGESYGFYDSATPQIEYTAFMPNYFELLTQNLGDNPKNICFFVALTMLISYYDTWYNDDIIPENYDATGELFADTIYTNGTYNVLDEIGSPGIHSELPDNVYDIQVSLLSQTDYLIKILDDGVQHFWEVGVQSYEANSIIFDILDQNELTDYFTFSSKEQESQTEKRNFIRENIDKGIPVLVGDMHHAMVACDYMGNDIYCHNGYKDNNRYGYQRLVTLDENTTITYAMALELQENVEHVCSDNYAYTDQNGDVHTHCPCELAEHPAHTHTFTDFSLSDDGHSGTCTDCGNVIFQPHIWSYTHTGASHTRCCTVCDRSVTESHDFAYSYLNSFYHEAYCCCGYAAEEQHTAYYICLSEVYHRAICNCASALESHHIVTVWFDGQYYQVCQECGHPDFCIDWEEYENGGASP